MTFEWPLGLLALLVLPLALLLYVLARRRESRYAVRFSNVGVLAQVVEASRSPWRFVPPALLCLALAAIAVGLARPQVSVSAERKQGTVVLALDRSGSMLAQDVDPDRMTASRKAAASFVENLPSGFAVGVVSFSDTADAISAVSRDKASAQRAITGIQAGGGTAIGDALNASLGLLGVTRAPLPGSGKGRAILLLSDGSNTQGSDPSTAVALAKRAGVRIYTIALGTPDGVVDLEALGQGSGHRPRPARPRRAQGDLARDRRQLVHRARPLDAEEGLRPDRHARQHRQGAEGSHLRGRGRRSAAAAGGGRLLLGAQEHHMTFADPYLLAALIVIPLALLLYVVLARRSRQKMRAAATPALWPNLMPVRPGWRRHVPPALLLLALSLLVIGAARPQANLPSDQKNTTVVLVVDTSKSMAATDVSPSRIAAARAAARVMIKGLPKEAKVGLISFARSVTVMLAPTDDRAAMNTSLDRLALSGGTSLGPAIDRAVASLKASHRAVKGRAIVVISDGKSTEGTRTPLAAAQAAKRAGVRVFTVSLGTANGTVKEGDETVKVPPDPTTLRRVASASGARFYRAADAEALTKAYKDIGSAVRPQHEKRDISFAFVGGAGVLVLGGSMLSLAWFRRLI